MLNRLGILSAIILILSGAAFLYGPVSGPETSHSARWSSSPSREIGCIGEDTTRTQIDGSEIKLCKWNLTGTSERKRALVAIATRMFRKQNTCGVESKTRALENHKGAAPENRLLSLRVLHRPTPLAHGITVLPE